MTYLTSLLFRTFLPVLLLAFALPVLAEPGEPSASSGQVGSETPSVDARPPRLPIYRPPGVGKPARTVGGGSRGPGDGFSELYVLVPDHVGRTASDQPALFWYIDEVPSAPVRIDFTLLDEDGIDPIVQKTLDSPSRAGIHRIQLSEFDVKLQAGAEYEWSISLIPDANARGKDVVSTGWIDRVDAPSGLEQALESGGDEAEVYVLAENGLWYDTLTALDRRIEAEPGNAELATMRNALLRQVGLDTVADSGD
jgi:hypothetical protein